MFASPRGRIGLAVVASLLVARPDASAAPGSFETAVAADGRYQLMVDRPSLQAVAVGERFTVAGVTLDPETTVDLELERFSVTTPTTQFVTGHDQTPFEFDASQVVLLRGHVPGEAGSHVFIAISPWGSIGRVEMGPGAETFGLAAAAVDPGQPVPVSVSDLPHPGSMPPDVPMCGTTITEREINDRLHRRDFQPVGATNPQITQQIEIAIDTDYELFELFGSVEATCAYMVELWGAVSDIYLRDVNTHVVISWIRFFDNPADPYNGPDPFGEFFSDWDANMGEVPRDVAQFVSGRRDFPYGGAATLGTLCTGSAYGVVGYIIGTFVPDVPTAFGYDVQVTAHELGHNCDAAHTHNYGIDTCDDLVGATQRGAIMSYCSQTRSGANANTDLRFHAIPQADMEAHIFTADCIAADCNGNGIDDAEDITNGSDDVNGDDIPDECQDCNNNSTLDPIDIQGASQDLNGNGVPDECEPDCNGNGVPDDLDIANQTDTDLYGNNIPDGCEADCDGNGTSDYTDIVADMTLDIDRNTVLDSCQDCDTDGTSDLDELAGAHNTWVASSAAGAPLKEFLAVSGVLVSDGESGVLDNAQDLIITGDSRVLVSSGDDDRVAEFDGDGSHVGDLISAGSGGLSFPTALVISPAGTLLVGSRDTSEVLEYDVDSGAFLGALVTAGAGGLTGPWGMAFGPDGNLYVTSFEGRIIEYDGDTGAPIGDFVTLAGNGGLTDPHGLLFKPNGNLLAASRSTDQILEYDPSGTFLGQFNHGGTEDVLTLDDPWTLRLGPDGDVYASRNNVTTPLTGSDEHDQHAGEDDSDIQELHINSTRIYIFDVDSGNFVRSYVTGHDTGLSLPTSFDFMPGDATDCNQNRLPDNCDIMSGFSSDTNGNGTPDECESICVGDVDGSGTVDTVDFLALLAAWGPNPGHPADFDGNDVVDTIDFLALLGAWGPCP